MHAALTGREARNYLADSQGFCYLMGSDVSKSQLSPFQLYVYLGYKKLGVEVSLVLPNIAQPRGSGKTRRKLRKYPVSTDMALAYIIS